MGDTGTLFQKLQWSLPWLVRYPFWRGRQFLQHATGNNSVKNLIFVVANHFEPAWSTSGLLDLSTQQRRLDEWCEKARRIGDAVRDGDGTAFQHTNFYPAEQYHPTLLEKLESLQRDGFGEVEVHLHHGVGKPDTAENLRRVLIDFRDTLAHEHGMLSYEPNSNEPKYAFVHGNLALANSAGGRNCGVDSEMEILAETGCYADFTLPSAPEQSQVPRLNAIYQCAYPLNEKVPHRSGPNVSIGNTPALPVIFTGPLVFDWTRRVRGLPVPRVEDGALAQNYPLTLDRFERWRGAGIGVKGRADWIFIKLYSHGFFDWDQDLMIGEQMKRFMGQVMEFAEQSGEFKIHFASAREAFNMVAAAVDGKEGPPGMYRDYKLRQIMHEHAAERVSTEIQHEREFEPVLG